MGSSGLPPCTPHPTDPIGALGWGHVGGGIGTLSTAHCDLVKPSGSWVLGYSQHPERPQTIKGVDGEAPQPVVAQDPVEGNTGRSRPLLFSAAYGCTVHAVDQSRQMLSFSTSV